MREYAVKNFKYGIIDTLEEHSIPDGAASSSLNWVTKGDKIELRRGFQIVGTEVAGTGRVTGLFVGHKADGTEVLFKSYARKVLFYDTTAADWDELGSNVLPAAADGLDVTFGDYASLAGAQTWFGNEYAGPFKVMAANPGDAVDQYNASKNFRGRFRIKQNRMMLWGRTTDKTGLYGSYVDAAAYTTVTAESIGTGDGSDPTFTGTLAFKGGGSRRTCFGVSITDGVETFTDDFNGTLTGSAGGTGTINYATGVWAVTFAVAPLNLAAITADYQWEDSTNTGIADFSKSAPRSAGQGFVFRQDDGGGELQTVASYGATEYCLHRRKAWALTLTADDTDANNDIYREKVGIPNHRAAVETGEGVYYIDDLDPAQPKFRRLTLDSGSTEVIPLSISENLDLSDYRFDAGACTQFQDLVIFACRTVDSEVNNRVIVYDRVWKSLDVLDYWVSCFAVYGGVLLAGDSASNNVYELFSGFDDDDSAVGNEWEGSLTDHDIEELKKTKRLIIQGGIGPDQDIEVDLAFDRGDYGLAGTIEGDGSYVDTGSSIAVGAVTIGRAEIGGGGDGVTAYNYVKEIRINTDRYEHVKIRFRATGLGYASVSSYKFRDIRLYGQKLPRKYQE